MIAEITHAAIHKEKRDKMKQSTIIKAYKVLNKLYGEDLPLPVSYKLYRLRSQLAPQWNFQNEKEREIFTKYSPSINTDGTLSFKDDNERDAFTKEFTELCNTMAELDADIGEVKKFAIKLSDGISLSMEDIEALQDFIDFEE